MEVTQTDAQVLFRGKIRLSWTITILIILVLIGAYVWLFLYARKRQKQFDEQYNAAKERHEVFVLHKKIVRESPQSKWLKFAKFKTYQVVGRIRVSQSIRGIQMSKMHTMTFHTTKSEYDKIQPNHKYKMDIAGNYIGYVHAPTPTKVKGKKQDSNSAKDGKGTKVDKKAAKIKGGKS
jgi:cbb3-type cytochrome oxidase subunit 3